MHQEMAEQQRRVTESKGDRPMPNQNLEAYARACLQKSYIFPKEMDEQLLTLQQLKDQINNRKRFKNRRHRARLIDQVITVLHGNYVFTAAHEVQRGIDPVATLLRLRRQLVKPKTDTGGTDNWEFCRIMTRIVSLFCDPHTLIELPDEISKHTGFVPFLVESYFDREAGRERYYISHVLDNCFDDEIKVGDEVITLNGRPVDETVRTEKTGDDPVFSSTLRFDRRNLDQLTLIPLRYSIADDQRATTLKLELSRDGGEPFKHEHMFLFAELSLQTDESLRRQKGESELDYIKSTKELLFASPDDSKISELREHSLRREVIMSEENLRVESLKLDDSPPIGYVRMFALQTVSRKAFVKRIMQRFADSEEGYAGLIIDLRATQGGSIRLAERFLARISGKTIDPVTGQMRNTQLNEMYCRHRAKKDPATYRTWADSIRTRTAEGMLYSAALPFSRDDDLDPGDASGIGIPALLIVDRNTASAAEVFAAGFMDNEIGEIIGTHSRTAGACAHGVRFNKLLMENVNGLMYPFNKESRVGRIRLAICRLLRAGKNAGEIIESNGIQPDVIVPLTRDDVLYRNRDLLATAVSRLLETRGAVAVDTGRSLEAAV